MSPEYIVPPEPGVRDLTPDEHTLVGLLLGFPECCVAQWVQHRGPIPAGRLRGKIEGPVRTDFIPGLPPRFCSPGMRMIYVPCDLCAARRDAGLPPLHDDHVLSDPPEAFEELV